MRLLVGVWVLAATSVLAAEPEARPAAESGGEAPNAVAPAAEPAHAPAASSPAASPAGTKPAPGLDRLLRVPSGTEFEVDLHGRRDRAGWTSAFEKARKEVADLERSVAETQASLREASPEDWGYTPPGATGALVDPEVQRLRAQLRRDRESLETARQRLRDLDVEASLAGVPEYWRREP